MELLTKHEKEKAKWGMMVNLLHHNVPRFIFHIKNRGGVSNQEWEWLQSKTEPIDYLLPFHQRKYPPKYPVYIQDVLDRADEYFIGQTNEAIFKSSLFVLVKAIAILSFTQSGVYIFDLYFSSTIDGFVKYRDKSKT